MKSFFAFAYDAFYEFRIFSESHKIMLNDFIFIMTYDLQCTLMHLLTINKWNTEGNKSLSVKAITNLTEGVITIPCRWFIVHKVD